MADPEREPVAWRIHVESLEGLTTSKNVMSRFEAALQKDDRVNGPAVSLNLETGALAATVAVETPRQGFAYEQARDAFYDALRVAGFDVDQPGWTLKLESEPLFAAEDDD